jgi:aminomethyltransferase
VRRTPLGDEHEALGGRMTDFHGWWMPLDYGSILDEHRAVRTAAGLFDVSHMGEVRVRGAGAGRFVDRLVTNRVDNLAVGRARYSPMTDERGGTIDDLMVYRLGDEHYLLVVNAARRDEDWAWIRAQAAAATDVTVEDVSDEMAELALQGPLAATVLDRLSDGGASRLGRFRCETMDVAGRPALVARTGYTGEDGFELYVAPADAVPLWRTILAEGRTFGVRPAGLGARDTLRLEAALPLYGQELALDIDPITAGLERFVDLDKAFIGRQALGRVRAEGPARRIVGLRLGERAVPRTGYAVLDATGRPVGRVTSGAIAPSLGVPIALALVDAAAAAPGTALAIEIRGRAVPAEVVATPFYKREARTSDGAH